MKSFTTNLMIAGAALMAVAGSASAQTLNVEVPFGFTAGDSRMEPGAYQLKMRGVATGAPLIQLVHADSGKSVMVIAVPGHDAPRNWTASHKPILSFACVNGGCGLKTVWNGESVSTLAIPAGKHSRAELAGVEIINIRAVKAD